MEGKIILFCFTQSLQAQLRKKANFDYADPSENFYVTQKRYNKYFKEHEKEEAKERKERSEGKNQKIGYEMEEELGGYELYKRWENFMAPRVYPSGDKTLASKAYEEYQKYINENSTQKNISSSITSSTWQPIGPFGDLAGANAGIIVKDIEPVTNTPGDPDVDAKHRIAATLGSDKYKETIKKADGYFKMKRWSEAKTAYEEALKMKSGDPYATGKLSEVEKLSSPK